MSGNESKHGHLCSCQVLSVAVTGSLNRCGFDYFRNVLQKRWVMKCNHGHLGGVEASIETSYEAVVLPDANIVVTTKGGECK